MHRILLSLLIVCASASVAAREVKMSSPDSSSCADTPVEQKADARKPVPTRDTMPAREARTRPSVHGDVGVGPRLRWHSFIPGMFR